MAISICVANTDEKGRELLAHGTAFFPAACYHDDLTRENVPWHWHDELEAVIVTKGTAILSAGSEHYTVTEGNGFFINTEVLHAAWNAENSACRFHSIVFHPRLVGGSMDSVFWQNYLQPLLTDASLKCTRLDLSIPWQKAAIDSIEEAWQYCASEPAGYEFEVRNALSRLIFLFTSHRPAIQSRPSAKNQRNAARIKQMLQFIQEHYAEELTTAAIAESAMIGESECLRCFHNTIGTTPIQYVKQFRIQKAAELLKQTDAKIAEIGSLCGFQEMSYFARAFREIKGCTPSHYRQQNTEVLQPFSRPENPG